MSNPYRLHERVQHQDYGIGRVTEVFSDTQMIVRFTNGEEVCNVDEVTRLSRLDLNEIHAQMTLFAQQADYRTHEQADCLLEDLLLYLADVLPQGEVQDAVKDVINLYITASDHWYYA